MQRKNQEEGRRGGEGRHRDTVGGRDVRKGWADPVRSAASLVD